jgi:hypothetical protein
VSGDELRRALPPMGDVELQRDLWPQMLRKMDERRVRLTWLDGALAAAAMVWLAVFPEAVGVLLYQL